MAVVLQEAGYAVPDLKCKFHLFPYSLICLICAKDIMIIVLQMIRGWKGWGWFTCVNVWVEGIGGGYYIFSFFCSVFVLLLIILS